jgi:hypothetical protein
MDGGADSDGSEAGELAASEVVVGSLELMTGSDVIGADADMTDAIDVLAGLAAGVLPAHPERATDQPTNEPATPHKLVDCGTGEAGAEQLSV